MLAEAALEKDIATQLKIRLPSGHFLLRACLTAAITFGAMGTTVWGLKKFAERRYTEQSTRLTQWVRTHAQEFIDRHIQGMTALTVLYAGSPDVTPEEFDAAAAEVMRKNDGFLALNYVNRDLVVENVHPLAGNRMARGLDLKSRFDVLPVAHRAVAEQRITTTDLVDLVQGGKGILLFAPIVRDARWAGLIEGVLKMDDFCRAFLEERIGPEHDYTIIDETTGQEVYTSLLPTSYERSTPYDTYLTLKLGDRSWWVILHPRSPPLVLLPLVIILTLELCLGVAVMYFFWQREEAGQDGLPADA
jgi:sensor domain CHASE-containing protein